MRCVATILKLNVSTHQSDVLILCAFKCRHIFICEYPFWVAEQLGVGPSLIIVIHKCKPVPVAVFFKLRLACLPMYVDLNIVCSRAYDYDFVFYFTLFSCGFSWLLDVIWRHDWCLYYVFVKNECSGSGMRTFHNRLYTSSTFTLQLSSKQCFTVAEGAYIALIMYNMLNQVVMYSSIN